jgi:hypothetical protein
MLAVDLKNRCRYDPSAAIRHQITLAFYTAKVTVILAETRLLRALALK